MGEEGGEMLISVFFLNINIALEFVHKTPAKTPLPQSCKF